MTSNLPRTVRHKRALTRYPEPPPVLFPHTLSLKLLAVSQALVFKYIYCIAYYNNRDLIEFDNNGFEMLLYA
jgi:hypothetical protein